MARSAVYVALAGVVAVYLLQLSTPLRINTDAISYLLMASSFHDGHGLLLHHHRAHYPGGYPVIVATLERLHLGNSFGLVGWNYLMLAVTVVAGVWVIRQWLELPRTLCRITVLMLLLSRCTIRYAVIPGSEPTYMALSTLCLACFTAVDRSDVRPGQRVSARVMACWIVGAVFMSAFFVRSIGLFLFPAAAWSAVLFWWRSRGEPLPLSTWMKQHRRGIGIAAVLLLLFWIGSILVVTRTAYFREGYAVWAQRGIAAGLASTVGQRCIEAGSILTNFWYRTDPRGQHGLMLVGIVALPLILVVVARRLRRPTAVDIYLVGYLALLLIWPYKADNRFWLPVQLFVYALLASEMLRLHERGLAWPRLLAAGWGALFIVTGAVVLLWTTRLTYAGADFSERYDLDFMRDAYRVALHNGLPADAAKVNPDLLQVMRRYGKPQLH